MNVLIVESWDGFKWYIDEPIDDPKKFHDAVVLSKGELSVLKTLYELSRGNEVFVDVGTHVGYYTVRMAKQYFHVHSFEPNPMNLEKLKRNLELNKISNVTVHPYALGDRNEMRPLYLAGASSSLHPPSVDPYNIHKSLGKQVVVQVRRMDDVLDRADVVKIDVEGWEACVLEGMRNIIEKHKPALIIEHHELRGYRINSFGKIRDSLKSAGYIPIFIRDEHVLYYHKTKPMELIEYPVYLAWINHCITNLKNGKPWYIGVPYTWWWGMGFVDFVQELRDHVTKEPEWLNLIIADRINRR